MPAKAQCIIDPDKMTRADEERGFKEFMRKVNTMKIPAMYSGKKTEGKKDLLKNLPLFRNILK
jgi:hypothetical protein